MFFSTVYRRDAYTIFQPNSFGHDCWSSPCQLQSIKGKNELTWHVYSGRCVWAESCLWKESDKSVQSLSMLMLVVIFWRWRSLGYFCFNAQVTVHQRHWADMLIQSNQHSFCIVYIRCMAKKKSCILQYFVGPPFALITEHICCGIVSTTLCNVTKCISIQSCVNFWPRFSIDDGTVEPFLQSFPLTPNTFNGVKVRTLCWLIHVWKWLLMLPDSHVPSCSTLSQLEPDESWHCPPGIYPSLQGRKKSTDGITWSFCIFRNSADLLCLDLTNWSNPRS